MYVVNNYPGVKIWDRRVSIIIQELREHLHTLARCALDGQLYTSERILNEELDIVRPCASVEKWLPGSPLGRLHKRHMQRIQQVLRQYLNPILVSDEVKNSFRLRFSKSIRPRDRDATLLVVACELADSGRRTLILAHDHDYEEPVKKLRRNEAVVLVDERQLSTTTLERWPYENLLLTLHESCCMERERFRELGYGFIAPEEDRAMWDKSLTPIIKKKMLHGVRLFRDELHRSIENKIRSLCTPAWQVS